MAETLGTDNVNLAGQGGAVTNSAGDALLGTDNDGGQAYALGPALSRAITTGIINGDFGTPPPELATNIDNAENALPYFTTEVSHTDATAPTVQAVESADVASGHVLRFTVPSGAAVARYARIVRFVAVPGSAARSWTNQPRAAFINATGTTKSQVSATITAQYFENDGTTTAGTSGSNSATLTTIAAATYAYEIQANPNGTGAIPANGAFLKITIGVVVNTLTTSALTVDLTEARYDRGVIQLLLADQVDPDTYGYGVIYLTNGTMFIRANELGSAPGVNPTITLAANGGNITIDPGGTGNVQLAADTAITGNLDTSGKHDLTGDLNIGVSDTSLLGAIVFKGGNGGSIRAFSASAGNDSIAIKNTSGSAFGNLVAENFFPGGQGSRFISDDGTRITMNSGLDITGTFITTGSPTVISPTATTQTASAAIFVGTSPTFTLRRNSSSARYKTDITDADEAVLAASRRVHPRHYESTIEEEAGATRLGFIAEEVDAAGLTHAVGYDAEGRPETIDATALIAALWKRVEDLEARLATVEGA